VVVEHAYNPSTREEEVRGSPVKQQKEKERMIGQLQNRFQI
jgi:hypothetical protein